MLEYTVRNLAGTAAFLVARCPQGVPSFRNVPLRLELVVFVKCGCTGLVLKAQVGPFAGAPEPSEAELVRLPGLLCAHHFSETNAGGERGQAGGSREHDESDL